MAETSSFKPWRAVLAALAGLALVAGVSGCGGAGAGAGGGSNLLSGSTTAADIQLFSDKANLPSAGGTATITAQLKDVNNNVLPNQQITFTTADSGVSLVPSGTRTDSAGKLLATLVLGSNVAAKTNRTVTVVASSGTLSRSIDIPVTGTTVAIAGPQSVSVGTSGSFTVSVLDSAGSPIPDVALTATSALANALTPAAATTGPNGQAAISLAASVAGSDTLSVVALGLTATRAINVTGSGTSLQVIAPAAGAEIDVNTPTQFRVRYQNNGAAQVGQTINFATTRGTLNGGPAPTASAVTDATGVATVTLAATSAGAATLTAAVQGSAVSTTSGVEFVSRIPAKITLSPSPTSIGANAPGSTSSSSQLIAVVRDSTDNPVKGVTVVFSAPVDPSSGSIQPGTAVTDSAGVATSTFIAGPNSTGPDAVTVQASVVGTAITATRNMTVSSVALFVELGTGNTIEALNATSYRMPWDAIVTDSNRNPVVGATVTASLTAVSYFKGVWSWNGTAWVPIAAGVLAGLPIECASEDANENNLIDSGEDVNNNGRLDPGSPAAVSVTSTGGKTDANGLASVAVIYPKSFGSWVKVRMRMTISTTGTESSVYRTFLLPNLAADVTNENIAPPNVNSVTPSTVVPPLALTSPYGYVQLCTDPN